MFSLLLAVSIAGAQRPGGRLPADALPQHSGSERVVDLDENLPGRNRAIKTETFAVPISGKMS